MQKVNTSYTSFKIKRFLQRVSFSNRASLKSTYVGLVINFISLLYFYSYGNKYIQPDEKAEYYTEERCHILELLNVPEITDHSVARARVRPGITTAWHVLSHTSEIYYILEGVGEIQVGDETARLINKNEMVFIPKNTKQRIKNIGHEDLVFLCICVPRFQTSNYQSLE